MASPDIAPPLPPHEVSSRPPVAAAACCLVAGFALLPLLYVGSFAYLTADAWNNWGVMDSMDQGTVEVLSDFYWPLIWTCQRLFGL
jgi:hypothetical protein